MKRTVIIIVNSCPIEKVCKLERKDKETDGSLVAHMSLTGVHDKGGGKIADNSVYQYPPSKTLSRNAEQTLTARITKYGATGNRTASGKWPQEGFVAVSDRSIPFGTTISIEGRIYSVEDRTSLWVRDRFPYLTVDIFSEESEAEMLQFGVKYKEIIIK